MLAFKHMVRLHEAFQFFGEEPYTILFTSNESEEEFNSVRYFAVYADDFGNLTFILGGTSEPSAFTQMVEAMGREFSSSTLGLKTYNKQKAYSQQALFRQNPRILEVSPSLTRLNQICLQWE